MSNRIVGFVHHHMVFVTKTTFYLKHESNPNIYTIITQIFSMYHKMLFWFFHQALGCIKSCLTYMLCETGSKLELGSWLFSTLNFFCKFLFFHKNDWLSAFIVNCSLKKSYPLEYKYIYFRNQGTTWLYCINNDKQSAFKKTERVNNSEKAMELWLYNHLIHKLVSERPESGRRANTYNPSTWGTVIRGLGIEVSLGYAGSPTFL